jgi:hypothetical protein
MLKFKTLNNNIFFTGCIISIFLFIFSPCSIYSQPPISFERGIHIGGSINAAAVKGDYVFLSQGRELETFYMGGENFERVNSFFPPARVNDIFILGDKAYLITSSQDSSFQILDIQDPLNPFIIGGVALPFFRNSKVHAANGFACVAMEESLKVVDVSDPFMPAVVTTLYLSAIDVVTTPQHAYMVGNNGLHIFDMADLENPTEISSSDIPEATAIFVEGNYAYVGQEDHNGVSFGVRIVDITDPSNPDQKGFFETKIVEGNTTYFKNPTSVFVDENIAYIRCWGSSYLFIVDISNKSNPTFISRLLVSEGWDNNNYLEVNYPYAYMTTGQTVPGFVQIDLTDINNPQIGKTLEEPWNVQYIFSRRDTLYVASVERLWIYYFPQPNQAVLLGSNANWGGFVRIQVHGLYLFGIRENRMLILDISNPNNIVQVGQFQSTYGMLKDIIVAGQYAFLTNVDPTQPMLEIVDISNPNDPEKIGEFNLPGEGNELFIPENSALIYVAYFLDVLNQGLAIIDIQNPASPTLLGTAATKANPGCIWVTDTLALLGSNTENDSCYLEKFNVSDPANPFQTGFVGRTGFIWDVWANDHVVIASLPRGSIYIYYIYDFYLAYIEYIYSSLYFDYYCDPWEFFFYCMCGYWWFGGEETMQIEKFQQQFVSDSFTSEGFKSQQQLNVFGSLGFYSFSGAHNPGVIRIEIEPTDFTMDLGQEIQFTAKGFNMIGDPITNFLPEDFANYGKIEWSTKNGDIDSTGLYTATVTGEDTITAFNPRSGATAQANINVAMGNLARIEVTPKEVSLKAGELQQFTVKGYNAFENETPIVVRWETNGGEIDTSGLYSATISGDFTVVAIAFRSTIADTAKVHVEAGELSRINVSPAEANLNFNDKQQFSASGFDAYENDVSFSPVWSTDGGTIDATGLFTANEVGDFFVTATDTTTSTKGTANVSVIPTGVGRQHQKPTEFALYQNYPNPFNPETTIEFSVKEKCFVLLNVFDITGRRVVNLVNSDFEIGFFRITFNARNLASGVYLYRIQMKNFVDVKKMVLLE